MAAAGGSKAFMLDKYFYELQRFWDTEWKLSDDKNEAQVQEDSTNNASNGQSLSGTSSGVHWTAYGKPRTTRPQPITGTPTLDVQLQPNKAIEQQQQQQMNLLGINLEEPPPVPPSRSYTVTGNSKLGFPQIRIMNNDFPSSSESDIKSCSDPGRVLPVVKLAKGEAVTVIGASTRRGHLLVEHLGHQFHVPYQMMHLPVTTLTAASIHDLRSCTSRRARSAVSSLSTPGSHKRNKPANSVIGMTHDSNRTKYYTGNSTVSR